MTDKKALRRYAGLLAAAVLLGGCGSPGTASETAQTTAAVSDSAETTVTETPETNAPEQEETSQAEAPEQEKPSEAEAETTAEGDGAADSSDETENDGEDVLTGIYEEITQAVELNSPMEVPEEFISNYFGIDVSAAEEYLFVMSEMATSAETIVIMKPGSADRQSVADSLQQVIDQKAAEMENYLPDQYDIVSGSSVEECGDYIYLVISENADTIKDIIEAGLQ